MCVCVCEGMALWLICSHNWFSPSYLFLHLCFFRKSFCLLPFLLFDFLSFDNVKHRIHTTAFITANTHTHNTHEKVIFALLAFLILLHPLWSFRALLLLLSACVRMCVYGFGSLWFVCNRICAVCLSFFLFIYSFLSNSFFF